MKHAKKERDKFENNLLLLKIKEFGWHKNSINTYGRIITDYNKVFLSKNNKIICYDNEGFTLYDPRIIFIKKGFVTKFKALIKGAHSAFVLDENKWMKIEKNWWKCFFRDKKKLKLIMFLFVALKIKMFLLKFLCLKMEQNCFLKNRRVLQIEDKIKA